MECDFQSETHIPDACEFLRASYRCPKESITFPLLATETGCHEAQAGGRRCGHVGSPGNQKEANRGRRRGMQADPDRRFTQLDSMSAYGQRRKRDGSITL